MYKLSKPSPIVYMSTRRVTKNVHSAVAAMCTWILPMLEVKDRERIGHPCVTGTKQRADPTCGAVCVHVGHGAVMVRCWYDSYPELYTTRVDGTRITVSGGRDVLRM
jgi:hypothetical protein